MLKSLTFNEQYAAGAEFRVHGHPGTMTLHSVLQSDVSDLPASQRQVDLHQSTSCAYFGRCHFTVLLI